MPTKRKTFKRGDLVEVIYNEREAGKVWRVLELAERNAYLQHEHGPGCAWYLIDQLKLHAETREVTKEDLIAEIEALWDYASSDPTNPNVAALDRAASLRDKRVGN